MFIVIPTTIRNFVYIVERKESNFDAIIVYFLLAYVNVYRKTHKNKFTDEINIYSEFGISNLNITVLENNFSFPPELCE
jgi:hypothetical protein